MNKIMFITGGLSRGGAQRVISIIANAYAERGWDTEIVTLLNNDCGYKIDNRVCVIDLSHGGEYLYSSYAKNIFKWIRNLRMTIKHENPDIIVSFVGRINIISMISSFGLKKKIVLSERNDPDKDNRSRLEKLACKVIYHFADCVVFQTAYQKKYYSRWCKRNGTVIGNPIAKSCYYGEHERDEIISVGKLLPQKNHPMLLRAILEVKKQIPDIKAKIYGDGTLYEELLQMINQNELEDNVFLCGNSDRIYEIIEKSKYFVMCSDYEGLSNALLEAMMSGMICISTKWNGVEELIENGKNGFIVPLDDSKALANLIVQLKTDMYNTELIKERAIETAKRFSTQEVLNKWFAVID